MVATDLNQIAESDYFSDFEIGVPFPTLDGAAVLDWSVSVVLHRRITDHAETVNKQKTARAAFRTFSEIFALTGGTLEPPCAVARKLFRR